jgi:hypothetical protein
MTTTNDGGPAHPMVMKAARGLCREVARQMRESDSELWANESENLILAAQAALTKCGALELLEALIHAHDNLGGGGADEWVVMEDFDVQIVEDAINSAGIEI